MISLTTKQVASCFSRITIVHHMILSQRCTYEPTLIYTSKICNKQEIKQTFPI